MLSRIFFINILTITILVLAQVFVFNNIYFFHKYSPLIYIVWVIFYPYEKSDSYWFLIFAFILGISVDFVSDTGGINAFATVLITQIKYPLLRYIAGLQREMKLFSFSDLNVLQFITYVLLMIIIHHLALYLLESFKFSMLLSCIKDALITSVFSFLFIIVIYGLIKNKLN